MGQNLYDDEDQGPPAASTPISEPEHEPNRPGDIAYTKYCETRGWKAFNGDKLPDFTELRKTKPDIAASWDAAAMAVVLALNQAEHAPEGGLPAVAGSCDLTPMELAHRAAVLLREATESLASPDVVQFLCDVIRMCRSKETVRREFTPAWLFAPGDRVKHVRTGGEYTITHGCSANLFIEATGEPAYVYGCKLEDGTIRSWVRSARQMEDGRFALVVKYQSNLAKEV
jgi:hypothetical protein